MEIVFRELAGFSERKASSRESLSISPESPAESQQYRNTSPRETRPHQERLPRVAPGGYGAIGGSLMYNSVAVRGRQWIAMSMGGLLSAR